MVGDQRIEIGEYHATLYLRYDVNPKFATYRPLPDGLAVLNSYMLRKKRLIICHCDYDYEIRILGHKRALHGLTVRSAISCRLIVVGRRRRAQRVLSQSTAFAKLDVNLPWSQRGECCCCRCGASLLCFLLPIELQTIFARYLVGTGRSLVLRSHDPADINNAQHANAQFPESTSNYHIACTCWLSYLT